MPKPGHKSKSKRVVQRRVPGGRTVVHREAKTPGKPVCAKCGAELHGIPKKVTKLIHGLVDLAKTENDKETADFLQWFVKEQVEEESTPTKILEKISTAGEKQVDSELEKDSGGSNERQGRGSFR